MAIEMSIEEALKRAIQTEKNAMDFYRRGARFMRDPGAKRVFELLAREEREHAETFYNVYPGGDIADFPAFMERDPEEAAGWLADLGADLANLDERKALQVALDKEQKLEESLREMAARIDDPQVRAVYEENARSTHNHYLLIESEYARLMGMVHESDIDTFVRE